MKWNTVLAPVEGTRATHLSLIIPHPYVPLEKSQSAPPV